MSDYEIPDTVEIIRETHDRLYVRLKSGYEGYVPIDAKKPYVSCVCSRVVDSQLICNCGHWDMHMKEHPDLGLEEIKE